MLLVNQLNGFGAGSSGASKRSEYITNVYDTAYQNPQSVSNVPIGTASDDRLVVIPLTFSLSGDGATVSSATLGGVSLTKLDTSGSVGWDNAAILYGSIPTGETATLSMSFNGNCAFVAGIYALYGLDGTSHIGHWRTQGAVGGTYSSEPGDIFIGSSCNASGNWTPNTQDYSRQLIYSWAVAQGAMAQAYGSQTTMSSGGAYESLIAQFR